MSLYEQAISDSSDLHWFRQNVGRRYFFCASYSFSKSTKTFSYHTVRSRILVIPRWTVSQEEFAVTARGCVSDHGASRGEFVARRVSSFPGFNAPWSNLTSAPFVITATRFGYGDSRLHLVLHRRSDDCLVMLRKKEKNEVMSGTSHWCEALRFEHDIQLLCGDFRVEELHVEGKCLHHSRFLKPNILAISKHNEHQDSVVFSGSRSKCCLNACEGTKFMSFAILGGPLPKSTSSYGVRNTLET